MTATREKLVPNDPRCESKQTTLNGRSYHYIQALPKNGLRGTVFLIHGWPDCSFGWRYQVPMLVDLGLRVVAMDMMGYGKTQAPHVTAPEDMHVYGFKRAADDIAALAKELQAPNIILGGHDWGGVIAYRTAQWHPELVTHVFSICTPYSPPSNTFITTDELVNSRFSQFGYQLQFSGPDLESAIQTPEQYRQLLSSAFGGRTTGGDVTFRPETGIDIDLLPEVVDSPLVDKAELNHYVEQLTGSGLHGTLNWYRNRKTNFDDELKLGNKTIDQPVLFIQAKNDPVLTPDLSRGMEAYISRLSRTEVDASHWAHWQKPDDVNNHIRQWYEQVVVGGRPTCAL